MGVKASSPQSDADDAVDSPWAEDVDEDDLDAAVNVTVTVVSKVPDCRKPTKAK